MAAGLGFKDFTTGEVLTANDVDGYLMQGVWVFASAAARDAAVTSPQEGNFAYLKDTNVTTYYTGSAWTNLDTTGMTNPMTTTGDMIYSSPGSTPVRLGIGSTGNVLTVAGGVPSWAAPSGGGKILQVVTATGTTDTTITSTSFTDINLSASITPTSASSKILVLANPVFDAYRATQQIAWAMSIVRGSTDVWISTTDGFASYVASATGVQLKGIVPLSYVDSPATTSSTTYKIQSRLDTTANSATITFNGSTNVSTITLMEIGA